MVLSLSPCDLLTCGEVKEDRSVHDVHLATLSVGHTVYGVFNVLKLNESLPHPRHHSQVAAYKTSTCMYMHI